MQVPHTALRAIAIILLALGLPVLACFYLAHRESIAEGATQTQLAAGEVLARAEGMADQMTMAYVRMKALKAAPCSDAARNLMISIALDSSYLKAVGYMSNDRVLCSSFAVGGEVGKLEPFVYASGDVRVWPAADLGTGKAFLVFEKGNYAAAVIPQVLVDIPIGHSTISSGVFGQSVGVRLAGTGFFNAAWRKRLAGKPQATFFDGPHLVTIKASSRYDLASYSVIPLASLRLRAAGFALVFVPFGLLLGIAAAFAVFYLVRQQASLPSLLRGALKRREFVVHYQPIVELASGRVVGAEALLRWPRHGAASMPPAVFIPVAESCGLIRQLTGYVLARVAAEAPAFIRLHPQSYISINLSSFDILDPPIVEQFRRLAESPGMAAKNLIAEVTEHSFIDPKHASSTIASLRALGIKVAIDDFGTGFSSLSHLTTLTTDYLKIDKVFIDSIGTDSATSEVAQHIVRVANSLQLTVIAEGVESERQAAFLKHLGVRYAQGWLFGKALPMEELLLEPAARDVSGQAAVAQ